MKALQKFSPEYLEHCKKLRPEEIINFLEQFRLLHGGPPKAKTQLISIKIPKDLLAAFKLRAELEGTRYQTQIKKLMQEWLTEK